MAIHSDGIVHRDLKPSNVLLLPDGPRVIDFGISRATEDTVVTSPGAVFGSPGFLSPEQVVGGPVGPASDIFSLGSTLVFAATGIGPFGIGDASALLYRVLHLEPTVGEIPLVLRRHLVRCLAKDAAVRPNPAEIIGAFDEILADLHIDESNWLNEAAARSIREYASRVSDQIETVPAWADTRPYTTVPKTRRYEDSFVDQLGLNAPVPAVPPGS